MDFDSLRNNFLEKRKSSSSSTTRRTKMKKLLVSTRFIHSAICVRRWFVYLFVFFCLFTWRGHERYLVTFRDSYIILQSSLSLTVCEQRLMRMFAIPRTCGTNFLFLFAGRQRSSDFRLNNYGSRSKTAYFQMLKIGYLTLDSSFVTVRKYLSIKYILSSNLVFIASIQTDITRQRSLTILC